MLSEWARRWIGLGLVIVVVLSIVVWWADPRLRDHEYSGLLRCVVAGQGAVSDANGRVAAITDYVRPALSAAISPAVRTGLLAVVGQTATQAAPEVGLARAGCGGVYVFRPYHRLAAARSAYLRYLDADADYLHDIALHGQEANRPPAQISRLRDAATIAVREAAPSERASRAADRAIGSP
jgi:hypothetical protein